MKRMQMTAIAAVALIAAAAPAPAQKAAAANPDGTHFCEDLDLDVAIRGLPDAGYAINYSVSLRGAPAEIRYARGTEDLFGVIDPRITIFYSGRLGDDGKLSGTFDAFAVAGQFGPYVEGRVRAPDGVRVLIEAGGLRSPPLTPSTISRERDNVSAALVAPGNALDANDVSSDWDTVGALADAVVSNGGTLSLLEKGRPIANVKIPAGDAAAKRPAILAYAARTLPYLKQGKCPN